VTKLVLDHRGVGVRQSPATVLNREIDSRQAGRRELALKPSSLIHQHIVTFRRALNSVQTLVVDVGITTPVSSVEERPDLRPEHFDIDHQPNIGVD